MEIWDLYDKDRNKTGETMVRGKPVREGRYHLVVHICIFNAKGELLVQHRQPFKHGWPDMWDLTVGGSAIQGETSQSAAEREVYEEIGYTLSLSSARPSLTVHFDAGFDDIYLLNREVDLSRLSLQTEEVKEVKWAALSDVLSMIGEGTFVPYHKSLIELLFHMKDHTSAIMRQDGGVPKRADKSTNRLS